MINRQQETPHRAQEMRSLPSDLEMKEYRQ